MDDVTCMRKCLNDAGSIVLAEYPKTGSIDETIPIAIALFQHRMGITAHVPK